MGDRAMGWLRWGVLVTIVWCLVGCDAFLGGEDDLPRPSSEGEARLTETGAAGGRATATIYQIRATVPPPTVDLAHCTLGATFVRDVTIPDDTPIKPGEKFIKTWDIRNTGSCAWSSEFALTYVGETRLSTTIAVPMPQTRPNGIAQVSVDMVAPEKPGHYRSTWRVCVGVRCFGDVLYAQIVSGSLTPVVTVVTATTAATLTVTPSPTATLAADNLAWVESHSEDGNLAAALAILGTFHKKAAGYTQAAPGKELVGVEIAYRNRGQEVVPCSPAMLKLLTADGIIYSSAWASGVEGALDDVQLVPGAGIEGWVLFEVPERSGPYTLIWEPMGWRDRREVAVGE